MMIATPLFSVEIKWERTHAQILKVIVTGWLKIFNIDWRDWGLEKSNQGGKE